ncbi:MAG TPA: peptide deformylase [Hyphomicrobiaceae bacterium]|nr:peptide deformylase [Hyphomicrobiaceae bacterium]
MTILPIILIPDPVLRLVAKPVERVDAELRALAQNMLETMYDAPGVGLAAPQVAVSRRLAVVDVSDEEDKKSPIVLINPKIVATGAGTNVHEEGCLSIPDVRVDVERPASVTVTYLDLDGKEQTLHAEGFLATAVQHEIDHLDGKLIIDHLSRLKRDMVIRKFKKLARPA